MTEMLEGVFTALVTPFRADGIDWDALASLIESQIDSGIHGLVPCGTTGESATLTSEEHDAVVTFCVERASGRVPILAGTGSNSTSEAVERTRAAREAGADAALVITPYYNRPTPAGLVDHYRQVAAVGLPIVVYNVPSRTGTALDADTYEKLASIDGVVATKEASGSFPVTEAVLRAGKLRVISGEDALTFPLLCLGACGVISVTSNIAPRPMVDLYDYVVESNLSGAREHHRRLLPLMNVLFLESNPGPVKAALALQGSIEEILRAPLVPVQASTREAIAGVLDSFPLPLSQ